MGQSIVIGHFGASHGAISMLAMGKDLAQ